MGFRTVLRFYDNYVSIPARILLFHVRPLQVANSAHLDERGLTLLAVFGRVKFGWAQLYIIYSRKHDASHNFDKELTHL